MGRKVHPIGFRLGYIRDWEAKWFAEGREYTELLSRDLTIRQFLDRELRGVGLSRVEIERFPKRVLVTIYTARPGIIIGRKGANINQLRRRLEELTGERIQLDVKEVQRPELDARLVAQNIAEQLERRISHRRAMKQAVARAMREGAKGIMITCSGRIAGAEMARSETVKEGRIPRNTLRADVDYGQAEALTIYGRIGVKVWIYRGDVLAPKQAPETAFEEA